MLSIQTKSLHHIDLTIDDIINQDTSELNSDLNSYIQNLFESIMLKKDNRNFKFVSCSTEVISAIINLLEDTANYYQYSQIIAERLLRVEKDAQKRIEQLGIDIQRGSLIQSFLLSGENKFFIITKVDHNTFLDEKDLKKKIGLPFEKYVLKSCLIEFNDDNEVIKISLFDSNNKITQFWVKDFLEVEELNTDEHNTESSFIHIEHALNKKLKRKYPSDYNYIYNNVVGYYKTKSNFVMEEFIEYTLGNYVPENPELVINLLKDEIKELPTKKGFDENFNIVQNIIKARYKRIIHLTEEIDLSLKSNIADLKNAIQPYQTPNDEKGIFIKSEKGFNEFKIRGQYEQEAD